MNVLCNVCIIRSNYFKAQQSAVVERVRRGRAERQRRLRLRYCVVEVVSDGRAGCLQLRSAGGSGLAAVEFNRSRAADSRVLHSLRPA